MSWYYAENDSKNGPYNDSDWRTLLSTGKIKPETLVWQDGMANWQPYSQVSGPASAVGLAPTPPGLVTCAFCKTALPSDEVISVNGQWVCSNCKPVAVQMVKEGVTAPGVLQYANFWPRFGAKFIDGILGYIIGAILGVIIGVAGSSAGSEAVGIIAGLASFIVQIGYVVYFNGKFGATLGKMALGLKIVRPDGAPLTFGRAIGRYFAEIVTAFTFGIGYIIAAFDDEKRALHDRIADTRVIKK